MDKIVTSIQEINLEGIRTEFGVPSMKGCWV